MERIASENTPLLLVKERPLLMSKDRYSSGWRRMFLVMTMACIVMMVMPVVLRFHRSQPVQTPILSTTTKACLNAEIWLIRHGEKDDTSNSLDVLYNLSEIGWQRAHYLATLVKTGRWPRFGAIFASAYASPEEIQAAWPRVATFNGQSLVKREYQTVLPLAKFLHKRVNVDFAKSEVQHVALAATHASLMTCKPILISWDHCSLPTLVSVGFGCISPECKRCWLDDQFDNVLKLNVTFEGGSNIGSLSSRSLSSRLIQMTREYFNAHHNDSNSKTMKLPKKKQMNRSIDARDTTDCAPSYCSDRAEAANMTQCLCFDNGNWRPLVLRTDALS